MQAGIDIANWTPVDDPMLLWRAINVLVPNWGPPKTWSATPPIHERVRETLASFAKLGRRRAITKLRASIEATLKAAKHEGRFNTYHEMSSIRGDGSIVHVIHYDADDDETACALLTLLMFDPKLGDRFRVCGLQGCGRYFLSTTKLRRYCSPEDQGEADALDAKNRMAKKRELDKRKSR